MDTKQIFTFIVGKYFFQKYAPGVGNWTHKMRGKDGRGKQIDFTPEDIALIKAGVKQLSKDLLTI